MQAQFDAATRRRARPYGGDVVDDDVGPTRPQPIVDVSIEVAAGFLLNYRGVEIERPPPSRSRGVYTLSGEQPMKGGKLKRRGLEAVVAYDPGGSVQGPAGSPTASATRLYAAAVQRSLRSHRGSIEASQRGQSPNDGKGKSR